MSATKKCHADKTKEEKHSITNLCPHRKGSFPQIFLQSEFRTST